MIDVPGNDMQTWKMGAFPLHLPIIMGYEIGINGSDPRMEHRLAIWRRIWVSLLPDWDGCWR